MTQEKLPKTFCPIKNTIIDAICASRFSAYETSILFTVVRKTYGWKNGNGARKTEDYISLSQFETATGIKQAHVSRTLRLLMRRRILTKKGKFFGVNKKTEEWMDLPKGVNTHKLTKRGYELTERGKKNLPKGGDTKERKETYTKEKRQPEAGLRPVLPVDNLSLKELLDLVYRSGFNIYKLVNKFKKKAKEAKLLMFGEKYEIPEEVLMSVAKSYLKNKNGIKGKHFPWVLAALSRAATEWWVAKQDKEHQEQKADNWTSRGGVSAIQEVVRRMMSGMKEDQKT